MIQQYQSFVAFGPSHRLVLALTFAIPLVLAFFARRLTGNRLVLPVRVIFAAAISGIWAVWYVAAWHQGWLDIGNALPLDLCSWAAIACVVALIRPSQGAYELTYFWALAGTLQGLLTPDIQYDFPEIRFLVFSIFHGGIIAAVLFMTFGMRMRPYPASLRRVLLWTLIYAAAAGVGDWLLKVNYGFFRAKPGHASLYDLMPPWPYYIAVVVVLALLSMAICYAPFFFADLAKKLKPGSAARPR